MSSLARRMGGLLNRVMAVVTMKIHIAQANLWRDQHNPLRGLNIIRWCTCWRKVSVRIGRI